MDNEQMKIIVRDEITSLIKKGYNREDIIDKVIRYNVWFDDEITGEITIMKLIDELLPVEEIY
jgi:hypothetical protein